MPDGQQIQKLAVGLAVVSALALGACSSNDAKRPTPDGSPISAETTVAVAAPATATVGSGDDANQLTVDDATPIPDDVALYVETGCWECDGPASGVVRLTRRSDGTIDERTIADGAQAGGIAAVAVSADGSQVAVSSCAPTECPSLSPPPPGTQTVVRWSRDGGVTYGALPPLDGDYGIIGFTADQLLLIGPYSEGNSRPPLTLMPSGVVVAHPPGTQPRPFALPFGVVWLSNDGHVLLDTGGRTLLTLDQQISQITPLDDLGDTIGVVAYDDASQARVAHFVVATGIGDAYTVTATTQYQSGVAYVGGGDSVGELLTNIFVPPGKFAPADPTPIPSRLGFLPAVIDVNGKLAHPLTDPFLRPPYLYGRNLVLGVMRGPFVRVTNTNSCLNIRRTPDATSAVQECVADDVLLHDLRETRTVGAETWRHVTAPDGKQGWANTTFTKSE